MKVRIRGNGMATPLGGYVQACAAHRAGIARFRGSRESFCFFPGDDEPQPVLVSSLDDSAFGFVGVGRLVELVARTFRDMQSNNPSLDADDSYGLYLAVPDPADRNIVVTDPQEADSQMRVEALGRVINQRASLLAGISPSRHEPKFFGGGNVASANCLAAALSDIADETIQRALIVSVDSYVGTALLDRLLDEERIKAGANPTGFVPGEAGVAVLIESDRSGRAETEGGLEIRISAGDEPLGSDQDGNEVVGTSAQALAECLAKVTIDSESSCSFPTVIVDADGEVWRSMEWGNLQHRILQRSILTGVRDWWIPAANFGKVGAATGAVGLSLGIRGLQRGYARSSDICITLSSEEGPRAVIRLTRMGE